MAVKRWSIGRIFVAISGIIWFLLLIAWGGFDGFGKIDQLDYSWMALRKRWLEHIKSTLFRPVLLIDEAQEMMTCSLNELRLLGSAEFDSQCLLTVILCGDMRLPDRFRSNALLALGCRIVSTHRVRVTRPV